MEESTIDPVWPFVVRQDGAWFLSGPDPDDLEPTSLDGVLRAVGLEDASAATPVDRVCDVGPPSDVAAVEAAWILVGRPCVPGLAIEDAEGVEHVLDRLDLVVIDAVDEPVEVSQLVRRLGDESLRGRVARLVAGGWLASVDLGPTAAVDADGPTTGPVDSDGLTTGPDDVIAEDKPAISTRADAVRSAVGRRARFLGRWLDEAYRSSSKVRRVRSRLGLAPLAPAGGAGPTSDLPSSGGGDVEREQSPAAASAGVIATGSADPISADGSEHRGDGRIPVYSVWDPAVGPLLSLGMLIAAARDHDGGRLNDVYDIRRMCTASEFLDDLGTRRGPAVLLCSDYVWSLEQNLDVARRARELNPELRVIHGGPSAPKYEHDAAEFLRRHEDVAHVLVRGEGEDVLCQVLDAMSGSWSPLDTSPLQEIAGLSFLGPGGQVVRTPDQDRIVDLDRLPSPYLTGEFDHIPADAWVFYTSFETVRGCPFGCTFCDWGSATLARLRRFGMDRVRAELTWAGDKGLDGVTICDSNFGIYRRDVEIAEHIAHVKRRTGWPISVGFGPTKNSIRHLPAIYDHLIGAELLVSAAISLQTTDPVTLEAVRRENISTDAYLALAADLRRRGQPLQGDVILGLPGMTLDAYKADVQLFFDHEIMPRTWIAKLLPNSPMNDPSYRVEHGVVANEQGVVVSTAAMGAEERLEALRFRDVEIVCERFGLLRHVLRYVQWDHGVPAVAAMDRLLDLVTTRPDELPVLAWTLRNFERFPTVAVGWTAFYDDVRRFLDLELGVDPHDPALATVLEVNRVLMPRAGRSFPASVELEHDYVRYFRDATASLYGDGRASGPPRPLVDYGPATFVVQGDPLELCRTGPPLNVGVGDDVIQSEFHLGQCASNELLSPLLRLLPGLGGTAVPIDGPAFAAEVVGGLPSAVIEAGEAALQPRDVTQRVRIGLASSGGFDEG